MGLLKGLVKPGNNVADKSCVDSLSKLSPLGNLISGAL